MLLGVVSDSHGRVETVERAVRVLRERQVDCVLHCGDIDDAATIKLFEGLTTHFVFGNCDSDRDGLRQALAAGGFTLHEPFGDLELAGKKIAFIHSDDGQLFRDVENSDHFDYLFYGHSHIAEEHQTGRTHVVNPGALHRARPKTFVIVDLERDSVERILVT